MIQRHLCKQLRDLISFFTRKWGPRKADHWSWVVSWQQTGGSPLHLRPGARRNETSQGSLIWSRCHATQRPVISRVSSLHEGSRWLHQAHCNVSPAERTVRVTATKGCSLSPSASGEMKQEKVGWTQTAAQAGPLWRLTFSSTQRPGKRTRKKAMGRADSSASWRLRIEPILTAAVGTSRLSGGWRSEPWSQKTRL